MFDEPADVRGTALLVHSHALRQDDQWLYIPARRVKRISSANKSGPFMGTEFAFEDMSSWQLEKYGYRLLGEERLDGMDVYVLEMTPRYEHSGSFAWIRSTIGR